MEPMFAVIVQKEGKILTVYKKDNNKWWVWKHNLSFVTLMIIRVC